MGKKIIISVLVLLVVLIIAGIWIGMWFTSQLQPVSPSGASPYTAVYMTTGDIYFGKYNRFPKPHMTDVWFLQRTTDQSNQQKFGIVPFANAFWGPVDTVNFNENQILFWANLRNDSQIVKVLENPSAAQQGGVIPAGQTPGTAPQGTNFQGPQGQPPATR